MKVTSEVLEDIDLNPTDTETEITQNMAVLLETPVGNIPLDRGMGIDMSYIDLPTNVADSVLASELAQAAMEYEPRADVQEAEVSFDVDGNAYPVVTVTYGGDEE